MNTKLSQLTEAELYELARERVEKSPALRPHAEFILADWPEGRAHLIGVITGKVSDTLAWVKACQE